MTGCCFVCTPPDEGVATLYAVWKDIHINYAVMAYGIGIDKDANEKTMGITFGPALGYPEFSDHNDSGDQDKDIQADIHKVTLCKWGCYCHE